MILMAVCVSILEKVCAGLLVFKGLVSQEWGWWELFMSPATSNDIDAYATVVVVVSITSLSATGSDSAISFLKAWWYLKTTRCHPDIELIYHHAYLSLFYWLRLLVMLWIRWTRIFCPKTPNSHPHLPYSSFPSSYYAELSIASICWRRILYFPSVPPLLPIENKRESRKGNY